MLKGLILRNYYNNPEDRTMNDIDILVNIKDHSKVKKYLIESGYSETGDMHPIHEVFISRHNVKLEVHWKLINDEEYFNTKVIEFENSIWKKLTITDFEGTKAESLSIEDLIIYLTIHTAVHVKYSGITLRHIYDIALVIKKENINWESLMIGMEKYSVRDFFEGILLFIEEVFLISFPEHIFIKLNKQEKSKYKRLFLKYMFQKDMNVELKEMQYIKRSYEYNTKDKKMSSGIACIGKLITANTNNNVSWENSLMKPIGRIKYCIKIIFSEKLNIIKLIRCVICAIKIGSYKYKIIKKFDL